jgi:hypothetical protein
MSPTDLTAYLIREHGGLTVPVESAAGIVGIGKAHAYSLIADNRFPVVGTTGKTSDRESMRVLLPHLVEWMYAGGTRQYDHLESSQLVEAANRGASSAADREMAWLEHELASA